MNNITCPIPTSVNALSPNGFEFAIQKLPEITFFCQQANIPTMSMQSPNYNTPFSNVPLPGDIITFEDLNVQFIVDDQMKNYKAIFNWMVELGFPENYDQYKRGLNADIRGLKGDLAKNVSDATLSVLGASNTLITTIKFIDLIPISLESLIFLSTSTNVNYLIGNAVFKYNQYKFI